ncbi:MAG TPA: hypothetical protein VJ180_10400 [Pyrinomonadaceae bacterium]|nr:hypothetical protein [Pyrinomonadaceae bacterium]
MSNSENSTDFMTIELKTEDEEIYRVPILRTADEVRIGFYPRRPEGTRHRFYLETKTFRDSGVEAHFCFGSRCVRCEAPFVRYDSTDICAECSRKWEMIPPETS